MAKTLVLYFSVTNNTKRAAEKLANKLNADIAEIHPAQPYTSADMDWTDDNSRTNVEHRDPNKKVDIKDDLPDVAAYDNVLIGYPLWWAVAPNIIRTVIDTLDLNGKTLATFATSASSPYDQAQAHIEELVKDAGYQLTLKDGAVLNSDRQIDNWVKQLDL